MSLPGPPHNSNNKGMRMARPEELLRIAQGPQTPQERIWWSKYSHEKLDAWRHVCDEPADACARAIARQRPSGLLEEVERRARTEGGVFQEFLDQAHTVPDWVDFDAMEAGRRVLVRHAPLQGMVLLCSSLVEGYAFHKPSQVLVQTGRLQKDVTRRIFETGQFLHNMVGPKGLRPGGVGHRTIMEVRLLHAAVRHFLDTTGRYPAEQFQRPINQEDMAGTILEFDFMVVRGMRLFGVEFTREERASIHYFWRYAGHLLGVKEELLTETPEEQGILALQLHTHGYSPTPEGAQLARALLRDMSNKPPFMLSEKVLHTVSRYLIGDDLADQFGIKAYMPVEVALHMARGALRVGNLGMRLMPDFGRRQIERMAHEFGRQTLRRGLGPNPANWGFSSMA